MDRLMSNATADPLKVIQDLYVAIIDFDLMDVKDKKGNFLPLEKIPKSIRQALEKATIKEKKVWRGPVQAVVQREAEYTLISAGRIKATTELAKIMVKVEGASISRQSKAPYVSKADYMREVEQAAAKFGGMVTWPD